MEEWLRDLAAVAAGAAGSVLNLDALDELEEHVARSGIAALGISLAFASVERARELARGNVNPQLVVSGLVRELRGALQHTSPVGAVG